MPIACNRGHMIPAMATLGGRGLRWDSLDASTMFGRAELVGDVLDALDEHEGRLVTVTGRGGVGKTRLAAEVVREAAHRRPDRPVTVVELAGLAQPELVLVELAARLGAPALEGDPLDHLVTRLRADQHLVLLDSFEHVAGAGAAVSELIGRCPGLRVLVTSQMPLRLRRERVVVVPPLPVPSADETDLDVLSAQPAVAAYAERAAAVDARFTLDAANAPCIAELCRRLEGLPLAIELAAARAASLPAGEIIRHLDVAELDLLQRRRPDAPARHENLRAALDWTYGLLSPSEQALLRRLSVLVGPFTIDDMVEMSSQTTAEAVDDFVSLVDLHLVDPVVGTDPARFELPSSIRRFAEDELAATGDVDVRRRHVEVRAAQARDVGPGIEPADAATGLAEALPEQDDLHAALRHAVQIGAMSDALALLVVLAQLWHLRGYQPAHEALMEEVLAGAEGAGADPVDLANALLWSALLGLRHRTTRPPEALVERITRAEELAAVADDDAARIRALSTWILVAPLTGDLDRAADAAERGLALAEGVDVPRWIDGMKVWAGMLAHQTGDDDRAIALGSEAITGARRRGDRATVLRATMLLLPLKISRPELVVEVPSSLEALEIAREIGEPFFEALLLPRVVIESSRRGDLDAARRWTLAMLRMARGMPQSPLVGFHLIAVAEVAETLGDAERAAFFHGSIRRLQAVLEAHLPPTDLAAHRAVLDRAREVLGSEAFEAAALRGEAVDLPSAVEAAIAYLKEADDPSASPVVDPDQTRRESAVVLTERQREVLRQLASGLSNKEIATRLGVSPKTVMHHTTAIYERLGVRGRSEATAWAYRHGLVGDDAIVDGGAGAALATVHHLERRSAR